jgi:dGTPase
LGKRAGQTICQRHSIASELFDHHDVGMVVAVACLAHDIGNPPFGHAGESAIASYFGSERAPSELQELTPQQLADLKQFEGNAQGFRILARTHLEADKGMRLTAATLAAFCKYPRVAGDDLAYRNNVATKKHGCFQHDQAILRQVAQSVGLVSLVPDRAWARHPLAYLVEAADDICYSILDIEDAVRLNHVPLEEAADRLKPIASKLKTYDIERYSSLAETDTDTRLEYLRARAIGQMIEECVEVFLAHDSQILDGTFPYSLAEKIPSHAELEALKELARQRCYRLGEVLEIELAGYEALGGLLEHFVPAVIPAPSDRKQQGGRDRKSLELLRSHKVDVDAPTLYERVLRVTDFVSGMTDRAALGTYRRLKGIAIPGRIA